MVPASAGLLLAAQLAIAADPPPTAPAADEQRKVRLIAAPAEKPPAPGSALATQVSILLGLGVAAILVWRLSGGGRRRRRHRGFGRLARRLRPGQEFRPGDNPFDDDPPVR